MATMSAEEYIATYGASLTEADRRYIRVFGAPATPVLGASRNPATPGLQVADAPSVQAQEQEEHRALMGRLDREAGW